MKGSDGGRATPASLSGFILTGMGAAFVSTLLSSPAAGELAPRATPSTTARQVPRYEIDRRFTFVASSLILLCACIDVGDIDAELLVVLRYGVLHEHVRLLREREQPRVCAIATPFRKSL
jgi:hypothetical protein